MRSSSQQALVKGEQRLVDFEDVVAPVGDEILHDNIDVYKRQILTRDPSRISRDTSSFMRFERKCRENGIRFE